MNDGASDEYKMALVVANEASRLFTKAQADYRARVIGDAEFLKARSIWKESEAFFDAALAQEVARESL